MRSLLVAAMLWSAAGAPAEQRLELVRHSLTGTHCRYRELAGGIATESYSTVPCEARSAFQREAVVNEGNRELLFVAGRILRRTIVEEQSLEPYAHDYDVATGELVRRIPLFHRAHPAWVFDPNPVASLNDPSLQDRSDAVDAVPAAAYHLVELPGLGEAGPMAGPYVTIVDRQPPSIDPPEISESLLTGRDDDRFEAINAYFHIDRTQRHLQLLGYTGERAVAAYPIEADVHAVGGSDNSFFIPSLTRPGFGTLFFGDGGTDDAEDADLIVHEYGHAILEWIAPGTFTGPFASEARAISEGFGDYLAFSAHVSQRLRSGRDPYCLADWDARCWEDPPSESCIYRAGADCLRRLDGNATMADYDRSEVSGVEHRNGSIWSSALREIHESVGREVADTVIVESLFGAPPRPTFAIMARRLLDADRLLYGGAHAPAICSAMTSRGIVADCATFPAGTPTLFQSGDHSLSIPENDTGGVTSVLTIQDPRTIAQLFVRVDIEHSSRGDLRIELVGPDGTTVALQQAGSERAADIHVTYGLTAAPAESLEVFRGRSAEGVWKLIVRDLRTLDRGSLQSWGLLIEFEDDEPLDRRPEGEASQMIPVVANLFGVGGTRFVSDVRIANPAATARLATLVFTPSGHDGNLEFIAQKVAVGPGATIAFDDVLSSAFGTSGSGTLEVLGDVVVSSRTYALRGDGSRGHLVPPTQSTTRFGEPPLVVAAAPLGNERLNVGLSEHSGRSALVSVAGHEIAVEPWSHVQVPVELPSAGRIEISAVEGQGRISAYLAQIDNDTGDAMVLEGEQVSDERLVMAPIVSATGPGGTAWRSDFWFTSADRAFVEAAILLDGRDFTVGIDVDRRRELIDPSREWFNGASTLGAIHVSLPRGVTAETRIRSNGLTQTVPFSALDGPVVQQVLFVEAGDGYRSNIGILSIAPALAEVTLYNASGDVLWRTQLWTAGGVAQVPVTVPVIGGRAEVRFLSGSGRAYGSLIDVRSGDATYVPGQ